MKLKRLTFHPFLLAIYPILALYVHNRAELELRVTFLPIAASLGYTLFLWSILSFLYKDIRKAALFVSLNLIFFFSYGHIVQALGKTFLAEWLVEKELYWLGLWGGLFMAAVYFSFKLTSEKEKLLQTSKVLNLVAAFLMVISLGRLALDVYSTNLVSKKAWEEVAVEMPVSAEVLEQKRPPDIYYLIFDRYASNRTLKEYYTYDNSEFTNFLEGKGFFVAQKSRANYPITDLSLASSLNMDFLDDLALAVGKEATNFGPIHDKIMDNQVWRFLKKEGYLIINVGSEWWLTKSLKKADINYEFSPPLSLNDFSIKLLETTVFSPFVSGVVKFQDQEVLGALGRMAAHRGFVMHQVEKLKTIPKTEQPKFVLAHFLMPHEPYVYDRDGTVLERDVVLSRDRRENYLNQLVYTNELIKKIVEAILANSQGEAVIILQADEGPFPRRYKKIEYNFAWAQATGDEVREKMEILNAFFLPDGQGAGLYSSITPVNTFRLIFNQYFGTDLPLLPDKSYGIRDRYHPYDLVEVTEKFGDN